MMLSQQIDPLSELKLKDWNPVVSMHVHCYMFMEVSDDFIFSGVL